VQDAVSCTEAVCDEETQTCKTVPKATFCFIDDMCKGDGAVNPDNPCSFCDPLADSSAWSIQPDGVLCDDGNPCTGLLSEEDPDNPEVDPTADVCKGGQCMGEPLPSETDCQIEQDGVLVDGKCDGNGSCNPTQPGQGD